MVEKSKPPESGADDDSSSKPNTQRQLAELIESCRASIRSLIRLANATSQVLHHAVEYEKQEPHLGHCFDVVSVLLVHAENVMDSLGVVSTEEDVYAQREKIRTACIALERSLYPSVHVVRAITALIKDARLDDIGEILGALSDLDNGEMNLVRVFELIGEELKPVTTQ